MWCWSHSVYGILIAAPIVTETQAEVLFPHLLTRGPRLQEHPYPKVTSQLPQISLAKAKHVTHLISRE